MMSVHWKVEQDDIVRSESGVVEQVEKWSNDESMMKG